jgi:MoxR-like ATPase
LKPDSDEKERPIGLGPDVLRHRLILTYEAEAQAVTTDAIIKKVFNAVPIP